MTTPDQKPVTTVILRLDLTRDGSATGGVATPMAVADAAADSITTGFVWAETAEGGFETSYRVDQVAILGAYQSGRDGLVDSLASLFGLMLTIGLLGVGVEDVEHVVRDDLRPGVLRFRLGGHQVSATFQIEPHVS